MPVRGDSSARLHRSTASLISAQADEISDRLWCAKAGDEYNGTFDNAAPNAVLLNLMKADELPHQAIVAFTGDEEDEGRGADQVVAWWKQQFCEPGWPACVVVLDVTEEGCPGASFTLENLFIGKRKKRLAGLARRKDLARLLRDLTAASRKQVIVKAECDEAWEYDEFGLTCFSLCLPTLVLGDDMHDEAGLAIKHDAPDVYRTAVRTTLDELLRRLEKDG